MLRCVSIIGPRNEPLFFRRFLQGETGGAEDGPELRYHFTCHSALDVLDERNRGTNKTPEMFLGLLCFMEEFQIYAYLTNSQLKILAVLEDAEIVAEEGVVSLMRSIHGAIQRHVMNPFSKLGEPIESPRFAADVARAVATYNGGDAESAASAAYYSMAEANLGEMFDNFHM